MIWANFVMTDCDYGFTGPWVSRWSRMEQATTTKRRLAIRRRATCMWSIWIRSSRSTSMRITSGRRCRDSTRASDRERGLCISDGVWDPRGIRMVLRLLRSIVVGVGTNCLSYWYQALLVGRKKCTPCLQATNHSEQSACWPVFLSHVPQRRRPICRSRHDGKSLFEAVCEEKGVS